MTTPPAIHWLFPLAVTLHNLEEALWLPGWSQQHPLRLQPKVGKQPFRFAVLVLTALAYGLAAWATFAGASSLPHYLLAAYALGQGLNIFVPHMAASILTRSYMPGLASGILLVLPAASVYLRTSFSAEWLAWPRFALTAALVIPAILFSLPLLFRLGNRLTAD